MKKQIAALFLAASVIPSALAQNITVDAGNNNFTGWTSGNTGAAGNILGSSATGINTTGDNGTVAWGLYANSGGTAAQVYNFGSNLAVGGSVTIKISLGYIDNGGTVGFGLQNSSGTNRFESYYIGGNPSDTWKLNDSGGQENIAGPTTTYSSSSWKIDAANGYQTIKFTLLASDTYSLSFNNVAVTNTGLNIAASDIDRIRIFNFNAGTTSDKDQYYNSLTVVPEPSTFVLLGVGAVAFGVLARRRKA